MIFTGSEKRALLEMAGRAVSKKVDPGRRVPAGATDLTPALESRCGVFVSLYVDQKLRGCIGTFSEEEPLYRNVERMAVSSATSDTRFSPIQPDELSRLQLEISVLTPRQRIHDPSAIEIGKHGIYMKKGAYRGTFLPQVAVSQDWTVQEFLGNCARYKVGIGWNGWKTAELYTYEAIVFSSEDPAEKS
jgi:AmmeMemoRadiSam system protein A